MAMMTTTALLVASAAVSAVGAGVSAYGQYQAGQSQKAMANYNAKLAENEAIAKQQQTVAETERMRAQKKRMMSAQRATAGKTGAMISGGTPLLVMAEEAGLMELDILNMRRTGKMEAGASIAESKMSKWEGKQAARAGMISAGGTLLSGAGNALFMGASKPKPE